MRFDELAAYLDRLEATSSRNELVRIVAELYGACAADEIEPITYLIQGRLAPFFVPVETGLGERLLLTAGAVGLRAGEGEGGRTDPPPGGPRAPGPGAGPPGGPPAPPVPGR